jgi:UDP-galactopyranose mutase
MGINRRTTDFDVNHEISGYNDPQRTIINRLIPENKIKDVICFSHLRWNFVFQRPQHLLSRWAKECRVFYFEEPIFGKFEKNYIQSINNSDHPNVSVVTPHIKEGTSELEVTSYLRNAVNHLIKWNKITDFMSYYFTPMSITFTRHLLPKVAVYDCMDELSCFKNAHPMMLPNEDELMKYADVVFTGGYNLYEYKKKKHSNIHPFPSSIDQKHFESGTNKPDPEDQANILHPRVGFFGVIDERFNIQLLSELADLLPHMQFIMIGPVVKIDPDSLPKQKNIHYLGQKNYHELPVYLANWDVAILPFAKNDSTRFISPTKTPEYLCAGKPVVSTSIRDVVVPYGEMGLVHIADKPDEFARAIEIALKQKNDTLWLDEVKSFLKKNSWDLTWSNMKETVLDTIERKEIIMEDFSPALKAKVNGQSSSVKGQIQL